MNKSILVSETGALGVMLASDESNGAIKLTNDSGDAVAVVVTPEYFSALSKERFFAIVDEIRSRHDHLDPDEVYEDATWLVNEVRNERREARRQANDRH